MKVKIELDRKGVAELLLSKPVGDACESAARKVAQVAATAPVNTSRQKDLAKYRAAFDVEQATVTVTKRNQRRAGAIVVNDSDLERVFGRRAHTLYEALRAIDGIEVS